MSSPPVVVIGGSAGALPVLATVFGSLPPTLPAATFVVVHIGAESTSHLARHPATQHEHGGPAWYGPGALPRRARLRGAARPPSARGWWTHPPVARPEGESISARHRRSVSLCGGSRYTCPECHGVLVQLKEGGVLRFRCHTGHAYSIRTLLSDVTGYIESSLWNALRAVEEAMLLFEHAARHVQEQPPVDARVYELLEHRARQAHEQADLLREALARHQKAGDTNV